MRVACGWESVPLAVVVPPILLDMGGARSESHPIRAVMCGVGPESCSSSTANRSVEQPTLNMADIRVSRCPVVWNV
jgi:hypothetical protein